MATDATGAPTSLGIPKYNTSADAPSGLGFNAAMDAIDALIAARVSKPAGIASGEVPVWNGSSWVRSTTTNVGPTSLGSGTPDATKFLRGDGAWVASAGYLAAPVKYTTLIDIVSSTTETDILQAAGYAIPANTLGASGHARLLISGDLLSSVASNVTVKVYFGGTTLYNSGAITLSQPANRVPFRIMLDLQNLGVTNSQFIEGVMLVGEGGVTPTTGIGIAYGTSGNMHAGPFAITGTSAIDTTSTQTLRVTWQFSTSNASDELRARYSLIEFV